MEQSGIGYLLLQQHCNCNLEKAPICCKDGWKLIYAGSQFTHNTESRYASTEGEAIAVAWSLEHSKFTLGCNNLIISTDHRPLLGIFNNKELNSINNPRLCNLKLRNFKFNMQYITLPSGTGGQMFALVTQHYPPLNYQKQTLCAVLWPAVLL